MTDMEVNEHPNSNDHTSPAGGGITQRPTERTFESVSQPQLRKHVLVQEYIDLRFSAEFLGK